MSFAQFEREVIGERVRDKIAASKRKGMWTGGGVPLGYTNIDKKLVVVEDEAEIVRMIFSAYLRLGSTRALAKELRENGVLTKKRQVNGKTIGGVRFGSGALGYLLKNRTYVGEIPHLTKSYSGGHPAIVDPNVFNAVQERFRANVVAKKLRLRNSPSLLVARIYDDQGNRMSPSHTKKRGLRYRYYVSQALVEQRRSEAGTVPRAPAPDIEDAVVHGLRAHFASEADISNVSDQELIERNIERVIVRPEDLEIYLSDADSSISHPQENHSANSDRPRNPLFIPWNAPCPLMAVKGIQHTPSDELETSPETRAALLMAIAKARSWIDEIAEGRVRSLAEIAKRENRVVRHIRLLMPLAFVAPARVAAIADGSISTHLTVTGLAKTVPLSWQILPGRDS